MSNRKIEVISKSNRQGVEWLQIVIKELTDKRKDGSQKWGSQTMHIPAHRLDRLENVRRGERL